MKLDSKILVAVAAMTMGVLGGTGCSQSSTDNAVAPEENAASAPVEEAASGEQSWLRARFSTGRRYYAPYGPPAARREVYGRAPSAHHFWAPGYHRWDGRQHVWVGGRWEARRQGYAYYQPRWERRWGQWEYVPGHWERV